MNEKALREMFKGYHIEVLLYPSGGMLEVTGCEECGTDDSETHCVTWKTHKGEDLNSAAGKLLNKMG